MAVHDTLKGFRETRVYEREIGLEKIGTRRLSPRPTSSASRASIQHGVSNK